MTEADFANFLELPYKYPQFQHYFCLYHRNGIGFAGYATQDQQGNWWIQGGYHPVDDRTRAITAIKRAILVTAPEHKAIGQAFLARFMEQA